jgi:hypothetical protein
MILVSALTRFRGKNSKCQMEKGEFKIKGNLTFRKTLKRFVQMKEIHSIRKL